MKGAEPNVLTYFRKILSTARPETFMPCLFFYHCCLFLFLIKLRWPKHKSSYDTVSIDYFPQTRLLTEKKSRTTIHAGIFRGQALEYFCRGTIG